MVPEEPIIWNIASVELVWLHRFIITMTYTLKGTCTLCRAAHSGTAKVAPSHKYMWTLCWFSCGMPFDAAQPKNLISKLSVPSKEAAWHMMSKGFQNGISQFEKKIRQSSPVLFHSFCNLKKVCKKFFFHVDVIAWWPSNFCRATKL